MLNVRKKEISLIQKGLHKICFSPRLNSLIPWLYFLVLCTHFYSCKVFYNCSTSNYSSWLLHYDLFMLPKNNNLVKVLLLNGISSAITTPRPHPDLDQIQADSSPHWGLQGVANQQTKQHLVGPETDLQQHLPCKHHFVCFSITASPEVQALREKGP